MNFPTVFKKLSDTYSVIACFIMHIYKDFTFAEYKLIAFID